MMAVGMLLGAWWLVSSLGLFPKSFFPSPAEVFLMGVQMFVDRGFLLDILASIGRVSAAFCACALLGIPLGLLMSSFKSCEAFFEPLTEFIRYVPVPSLLPLFVLWTGIGETPKFLVLFCGTFFQLTLLVMDDADNVPAMYFDVTRTMGRTAHLFARHSNPPPVSADF